MPFFVPALLFVARTAAPYVLRHIGGQGARQVALRVANHPVGNATVRQVARTGAISGETMTYVSAASQYSRNGQVDIGEALAEGALAAASLGGAVAFAPAVGTAMTGREFLRATRQLLPYTVGTASVMTVGRVLVTDEDPLTIAGTTLLQTPIIAGARVGINAVFATRNAAGRVITPGLQTTQGIIIDTARNVLQEYGVRELAWSRADSSRGPDFPDGFLNARPRFEPDGSVQSAWPRCTACQTLGAPGSPDDIAELEAYLERVEQSAR